MSQFRQFWIDDILNVDRPSTKTAYVHEQDTEKCHRPIHVIEIAALEAAQKEIEELRSIFSVQLDILEQNEQLTAALKVAEDALEEYKKESHDLDQVCCDYGVQVGNQEWVCCGQPITKAEKAQYEIKIIKKGLG